MSGSYKFVAALTSLLFALLLITQVPAYSQTVTASLSGTVTDATGAVIPGAKVVITNEATSVSQTITTNRSGFFNFVSLFPGRYTLEVSSEGMITYKQTGIVLQSQETRAVPNIALKVGAAKEEVTVVAEAAPVLLSSGESSTTLSNTMVSQLSVQGRDAAELIKLMPGMAINNGLNNSEWNSALTQINSGPIGAFSASGTAPNGGLQMIMNGSVITDAGNQGTQIANVNQDMTQEVTIQNASFDAEHAHGPVTFSATGKSGGDKFHGAAYAYTRNGSLNSNDSFFNASGAAKPIDHYWYLGGNIGGPVVIPHTKLTKGSDKAFFFVGYEHMKQEPNGTLHKYMVPTAPMMTGDFTAATLKNYAGFAAGVPCASPGAWNYGNFCQGAVDNGTVTLYQQNGTAWTPAAWDAAIAAHNADPNNVPEPSAGGATIDPSLIDSNGVALMKALAAAPGLKTITPTAGNPYNAEFFDNPPVVSYNLNARGDVNVSDKIKVFATYSRQPETDQNNIGVWWWEPMAVPYPSAMPAKQLSRTWSVGVTTLFSPTLVNEATFGYAYFINPITLSNPAAADPSSTGYNVPLPAGFSQNVPQYPASVSWCCGINNSGGGNSFSATTGAGFQAPSFGATWQSNGAFGKDSYTPDFSDSLSWVKGPHTMKFGFFWAAYANVQTENCCGGGTAGSWDFDNYGSNTSFNYYSDMLIGHAQSFSTTNNNPTDYVKYNEYDFFAQDSWKATRRLTLNFGVRMERMGQWYTFGSNPQGLMVWDPNNSAQPYNAASPSPLMGFSWNAIDKSVPLSGWSTGNFKPDPRIGAAFDVFGNGKTVVRGGFGIYRFQVAYNDVTENGILSAPLGTVPFASNCTFTHLTDLSGCAAAAAGALNSQSYAGLLKGDNKTPYTQTWNVMIDQRGPFHSMFEIQYQGNRSRDLLISQNGAGGIGLANINYFPMGSEFQPDPVTGITYFWQGTPDATHVAGGPPGGAQPDFRPYAYSGLYLFRHGSYSNYNALMLQWMKQAGPVVFNLNYTWSHALGIRDGNNDNGQGSGASLDAFNLANNYGVLAFNRAQIFNASYVANLPNPVHDNAFLKGVVNGWQLSGDTQFQTGVPLQPLSGGRLNASFPNGISADSVLGTNGIQLIPLLTCNPGANLPSGHYFNPSCFATPTNPTTTGASIVGQNGPLSWPNIPGPGFFNSDLGLYKNFKIKESQGLQFRITAFNFMNHPLPQFGLSNDINLSFGCPASAIDPSTGACTVPVSQYVNTNGNTTGRPAYKVGRRTIELALKYTF